MIIFNISWMLNGFLGFIMYFQNSRLVHVVIGQITLITLPAN